MFGITLNAPDCRPGEFGDTRTLECETVEHAHKLAHDLNSGIYLITAHGVETLWETDGTERWEI